MFFCGYVFLELVFIFAGERSHAKKMRERGIHGFLHFLQMRIFRVVIISHNSVNLQHSVLSSVGGEQRH